MKTVLMDKMNNALQYLNTCLAEREELLRFMAVAVLTRRNLFILGLPGQAKSDAIRRFRSLSLIHISEPTRLGMISYAVFCLKKKK